MKLLLLSLLALLPQFAQAAPSFLCATRYGHPHKMLTFERLDTDSFLMRYYVSVAEFASEGPPEQEPSRIYLMRPTSPGFRGIRSEAELEGQRVLLNTLGQPETSESLSMERVKFRYMHAAGRDPILYGGGPVEGSGGLLFPDCQEFNGQRWISLNVPGW